MNALIIRLKISAPTFLRISKRASADVANHHHAELARTRAAVYLVGKEATAPLRNSVTKIRRVIESYTLPYDDDGRRLLPATLYVELQTHLTPALAEFRSDVAKFVAEYPAHIAKARAALGDLFDEAQFPHVDELKNLIDARLYFTPVPEPTDLVRVQIDETQRAAIAAQMQAESAATVARAVAALSEQLHKVTADLLRQVQQGTPMKAVTLRNLQKFLDRLPALDIAHDATINAAAAHLTHAADALAGKSTALHVDTAASLTAALATLKPPASTAAAPTPDATATPLEPEQLALIPAQLIAARTLAAKTLPALAGFTLTATPFVPTVTVNLAASGVFYNPKFVTGKTAETIAAHILTAAREGKPQ